MHAEIQTQWVEALRSGEYKQATHRLKSENGHCCLGVLCEVYGKTHPRFTISPHAVVLPKEVSKWAGLTSRTFVGFIEGKAYNVVSMNDQLGYSFCKIADFIEKSDA